MTRDEAVAQIHEFLGFRSGLTTNIQNHLIFQQNELEHEPQLPYFLRYKDTGLATVASTATLAKPTGFIRIWEEDGLQIQDDDGDWHELVQDDAKYLRSVYQNETGIPVAFAFDGINDFEFFPTPDAVYPLRMTYYKEDAVLSSNITNLWLTHLAYLLIGRAGAAISASVRDQNASAIFGSLIASETAKLNNMTTERDSHRYVIGGDD